MSSKRMFSWSKRQPSSEPYYRTGGLLPIDANWNSSRSGDTLEEETASQAGVQRPTSFNITLPISTQSAPGPTFAQSSAAFSLQAAYNDILHSPALGAAACARSASLQKPLPSRPHSVSMPTTPELPVELPGLLGLENHGLPSNDNPLHPWTVPQALRTTSRDTRAADRHLSQKGQLDRSSLIPEPLKHTKSVPNMSARRSTMTYAQSWTTLNSTTATGSPYNVQHQRSRLDPPALHSNAEKKSKQSASRIGTCVVDTVGIPQPSPSSVASDAWNTSTEKRLNRRQDDLSASVRPTATTPRSKQIEDLKTANPNQEHTMSALQAQFGSLPASLATAQVAEVTTLRTEAGALQGQQKPSLHDHTSSNNLLFLGQTTEPLQILTRKILHETTSTVSPSSTPSCAQEKQQRSPQGMRTSPDMEKLKRKLSSTRRLETTSRNLLPELNQYKQNNVALQKQIKSLMAKLNDCKKRERESRAASQQAEQERVEWQAKADKATGLVKGAKALQNTLDHLESRLAIANIERLDAQEQLCNMRANRSPFDTTTELRIPIPTDPSADKATQDPNMTSMSTIFSNASPSSPDHEARELSTLSAFVTHIGRLQDQVKQKNAHILELNRELHELRSKHEHLQVEHTEVTLRSDIQADLLQKSRQTDSYIEQLRTAVLDREAIIVDKEESLRAVERQLDLHKLLLQAEIRRHATLRLNRGVEDEALPALATLANPEDLDRWISNLNRRLHYDQPTGGTTKALSGHEAEVKSLRHEIEFYVREIIYYKLDIRGYKSDIRKLKRITTRLSSYGSRVSNLDCEKSSPRPVLTSSQSRFASVTPELRPLNTTSPIIAGPMSMSPLAGRPSTPTQSQSVNDVLTPPESARRTDLSRQPRPDLKICTTPQVLGNLIDPSYGEEAVDSDTSAVPPDPKGSEEGGRKPTSPARGPETFGDLLATAITPDPPLHPDASGNMSESLQHPDASCNMSESLLELRASTGRSKRSNSVQHHRPSTDSRSSRNCRNRSSSLSDTAKSKTSPDRPSRPSRPRLDLFRLSTASSKPNATLPQSDITGAHVQHFPEANDLIACDPLQYNPACSANGLPFPTSSGQDAMDELDGPTMRPSSSTATTQKGPARSNTGNPYMKLLPPLERKLFIVSNTSIPFVIGMGSPHNPALITPVADYRSTPCSITRNAPLKINTSIAKTGVGDTMAPSAPIPSTMAPTNAPHDRPTPKPTAVQSVRSRFATPPKVASNAAEQGASIRQRGPRTPLHPQMVSRSSIRTAIRIPRLRDKER